MFYKTLILLLIKVAFELQKNTNLVNGKIDYVVFKGQSKIPVMVIEAKKNIAGDIDDSINQLISEMWACSEYNEVCLI